MDTGTGDPENPGGFFRFNWKISGRIRLKSPVFSNPGFPGSTGKVPIPACQYSDKTILVQIVVQNRSNFRRKNQKFV